MASYNELNALIDAYINRNGVQAITGQILNGVLKAMVEQLGRGYTIMGVAGPTTDPGTPDAPESYFASQSGTYTKFGGIAVASTELCLLCYTPGAGWDKRELFPGIQSVNASIDEEIPFPSVDVTYNNGVLSFDFHSIIGEKGDPGTPAEISDVFAQVDANIGTPSVDVTIDGPSTGREIYFNFHNLKGETGVTSVLATVDNTVGTPQCAVSLVGQQLTLAFTGLKGAQGDTGVSADYPIAIINNLTTDDPASALSAAQGVVLDGKVTQLEAEVDDLGETLGPKITAIGTLIVSALKKAVYNSDDVETIITAIEQELVGEILSLDAVYTQSEDVYVGQSIDDLRNDLVVTANYTDGTSVEISAYALSGTLSAGSSTISVSYGGKNTSFVVTVLPALYYRENKFYYKGALTATSISSPLSHIKVDGVTYVYTQKGSSLLDQRACYFYFDLELTPGVTYNYKFYYSGLPSGVTLKLGIQGAKQSFWNDGVANTFVNHARDLVDSGWLFPTVSDGIISQNLENPSSSVGVRLLFMAIDSGGNGVEWPSSLKIDRFVINPA